MLIPCESNDKRKVVTIIDEEIEVNTGEPVFFIDGFFIANLEVEFLITSKLDNNKWR